MRAFLRGLFAAKPKRRCDICGEELLVEAHVGNGAIYGDFCRNPHPVTSFVPNVTEGAH